MSEGDTQMTVGGAETGNIKESLEYRFFMHRHWSLFDAMFHSPYIASKLKVWQTSGKNQLQVTCVYIASIEAILVISLIR